ncbi:hypothetical protein [Halolamina sp. C58]|uniref:hypothetical protein n=1 Tax=Halolamina sp. C58 TaxID=3421640 RepID=UPI003EC06E36
MSRGKRLSGLAALALAGATAVVLAELAALALSVRLAAAAVDGWLPASASTLPVVAVAAAAGGLTVVVARHADRGVKSTAAGAVLIAAAPVTAFGGGCGFVGDGVSLFRSGVRLGVAVPPCVTFLNGALLVLGYGLLAAGLWFAVAERWPSGAASPRSPERSD